MNHQPFDHGALHLIGALARQKSVKALCGARVAFTSAHPDNRVECPHCRAELVRQRDSSLALLDDASLSIVSEHVRGMVRATAERSAELFISALER